MEKNLEYIKYLQAQKKELDEQQIQVWKNHKTITEMKNYQSIWTDAFNIFHHLYMDPWLCIISV